MSSLGQRKAATRGDSTPLAIAMNAYLERHNLTLTTGAEHFGVKRDWLRAITAGQRGKDTAGQVMAQLLDRL